MRNLFSFWITIICLMFTANSAKATVTVTMADFDNLPTTYGTFTGNYKFTTNTASGIAGLTIEAKNSDVTLGSKNVNTSYGKCFSITTSDTDIHIITLTAPEGYVITGYSLAARSNSSNYPHTLTPSEGGSAVTSNVGTYAQNAGYPYLTTSGLFTQATTFTIQTANSGNPLYIPYFTVTLQSSVSTITSGHYYRLHNVAYPSYTMCEIFGTGKVLAETNDNDTYSQIWKVTKTGTNTYSFQNVMSGKYIQANPGQSKQFVTGINSANFTLHTNTSDGVTSFAFDNGNNGYNSLHCANTLNYTIVGWTYSGSSASYWNMEEVSLSSSQLAAIEALRNSATLTNGNYYRFTNAAYPDRSMAEYGGYVSAPFTQNTYSQFWKLIASGSGFALQNALTDNYIQSQTNTSSQYAAGSTDFAFNANLRERGGAVYVSFNNPNSSWFGLHCSSSQSYNIVGWDYNVDSSWWIVEGVTINESELSALKEQLTTNYTTQLATFFEDAACTTLKSTYQSYSDANLRSAMSSLPSYLQDMAVSVKNNVWTTKSDYIEELQWNTYEKNFRIHDYEIYSSNTLWTNITDIGPFARLTQPTGITANADNVLQIFVGSDVEDSDASLEAELVVGIDRKGGTTPLHRGHNSIYVDRDCELFITYMLNNTSKSCNNYPNITIHIEGGTCNGCFDMHRGHTNTDWEWLKKNMFTDEFVHVKGETTLLNCYRERVVDPSNTQDVEKIMKIWDFCFDNLESLAGCNQWKNTGQYKMMTNNYDITSGNPHWGGDCGYAQPGIWYNGIFNANNLSNVGGDGGNIWVIMHELGHGHQDPINLSGQTESSNNSLAQCVNFLTTNSTLGQELFATTRSSRGDGVKAFVNRFNQEGGYSWIDYGGMRTQSGSYNDVWISNKLIFQLWLYFDYMGNYPQTVGNEGFSFMTALYDALRNDPLLKGGTKQNPKMATTDWLKLAKYAAQITQTDLSEYFEAWGFWKLAASVDNANDDTENSIWYFGDYVNNYIQTTQAQIDEVMNAMKVYPTKGGNIMFLEDRGVGSTLATYNNAATSTFGDVGYYGSYSNKVTNPYSASVSGTTVTLSGGSGAVGFKVYDATGNLVAISNTNTFTVTSAVAVGISNGTYTVKAAQGDGTDYAMGQYFADGIPYVLKYNNTEIARNNNVLVTIGEAASTFMPSALTDLAADFSEWISYSYEPATITNTTTEVTITATWNGPFVFSTDFASAKWYNMTIRTNKYVAKKDSEPYSLATATTAQKKTNEYLWAFAGTPYSLQLWNKASGTGYTLTKDGANVVMREGDYSWTLRKSNDGFVLKETGTANNYINDVNSKLQFWNTVNAATDNGSTFRVEEIIPVTYNLLYNNAIVKTTNVECVIGETPNISDLSGWDNGLMTYTYDMENITASTTTVNITATWNGPFEFSTDFASAHWYNMTIRSTKYVAKKDTEPYALATANFEQKASDAYQWALAGTPYAVKLWNKASGTGHTLTKNDANVVMREGDYTWTIQKNSDGFVLKENGTANNYVNDVNSKLQFWNSTNGATDNGSTFRVEEVMPISYITDLSELSNNKAYIINNIRATWAVSDAEASSMTTTTQVLTLPDNDNLHFAIIKKNDEYYLYNVKTQKYLSKNNTFGNPQPITILATGNANYPWFFKFDNTHNINVGGSNQITIDSWTTIDEGNRNRIIEVADFDPTEALSYWFDFTLNTAKSADNATYGYATAYYPRALALPDDVNAYVLKTSETLTVGEAMYIIPTNIGNSVPANTPVLLVSDTNGSRTAVSTNMDNGSIDTSDNILVGTSEELTSTGSNILALNKDSEGYIGFYNLRSGAKLATHRAYIPYDFDTANGVHALVLWWNETDGIQSVETEKYANGKYYDLSGRSIQKPTKGMYIVNGKKIIIK